MTLTEFLFVPSDRQETRAVTWHVLREALNRGSLVTMGSEEVVGNFFEFVLARFQVRGISGE